MEGTWTLLGGVAGIGGGAESINSRDTNGRIDGWIEHMMNTNLANEGAAQEVAESVRGIQVCCRGPAGEVVSNQLPVIHSLVARERSNVLEGNARKRDKQRRKRQRIWGEIPQSKILKLSNKFSVGTKCVLCWTIIGFETQRYQN